MSVVYTVGNLIDDTIHQLLGSSRTQINFLNISMGSTAGTAVVTLSQPIGNGPSGIAQGSYIEIDQEEMYVISTNSSLSTVTVQRGMPNSTLAAHSAGAVVYINTPFPRWQVAKHLRDEIRSWGPQVYQVAEKDITLQIGVRGYDLGDSSSIYRVYSVTAPPPPNAFGFTDQDTQVAGGLPNDQSWPNIPFEFFQSANTTAFPSGNAIVLQNFDWPWAQDIVTPIQMHVVYFKPFDVDTAWTESTDCIANVGLDTTDIDIAPLGAAWRMMQFREIRRTMTELQGEPRDAQEVAALFITRTAEAMKQQRDSRLNDAALRLMMKYNPMMSNYGKG